MLPENIMDKNMRKPSDPNYDPSSIFISKEEFSELTDDMKRFWKIIKNMDKVLSYIFND